MKKLLALIGSLLLFTASMQASRPTETHLFAMTAFNPHVPQIIGPLQTVPFDTTTVLTGGDLVLSSADTITINSTGTYSVSFMGSTYSQDAQSVVDLVSNQSAAEVQLYLNDKVVGPEVAVQIRGGCLVIDTLVSVPNVPSTLNVKVNAKSLRLGKSNAATIKVVKISNNP